MLKLKQAGQAQTISSGLKSLPEGTTYSIDGAIVPCDTKGGRHISIVLKVEDVMQAIVTSIYRPAEGFFESHYQFGPGFGELRSRSFSGKADEIGSDLGVIMTGTLNDRHLGATQILIPQWKALLGEVGPKGCEAVRDAISPYVLKGKKQKSIPQATIDPLITPVLAQIVKELHGAMFGKTRVNVGGYEVDGCAAACTAVSVACIAGCGYMSGGLGTATGACGATCAAAQFACLSYCTAQTFPQ